jgi:hypothetical protein
MPSHLPKTAKPRGIVGISTMTFDGSSYAVIKSVAGLHRAYPSAALDKIKL